MESRIAAPQLSGNVMGRAESDFVVAEWRDAGRKNPDPPRLIAPLHLYRCDDELVCARGSTVRAARR